MPYIKKDRREELKKGAPINSVGELNYVFTYLILDYISRNGKSYEILNGLVGALECCKLELYRRLASPYEDEKIKENGDVY